jgi:hypothetical protein
MKNLLISTLLFLSLFQSFAQKSKKDKANEAAIMANLRNKNEAGLHMI